MAEAWLQLSRNGFLVALAAFAGTAFFVVLLRPLAPRLGLVDHPGGRKTHAAATPLVGGIAIVLGSLVAGALLLPITRPLAALACASLMLLVVGMLDDRFDVNWRVRILAQSAAAAVLYFYGGVRIESIGSALGFPGHSLGVMSLPFTVAATVGVTNAVNMVDGVDGLAGTIVAAALVMLIAAAVYAGNAELVLEFALMAGAVAGFLVFNLRTPWHRTASAFLGGGSEILGLGIAWAAFRLTQTPGHPVTPVLAPLPDSSAGH